MKLSNWIWILVIGVIAVLLLGWAGYDYLQERAFLARAETDTGTIIAVENNGARPPRYCPRVKFTTQAGEPTTFLVDPSKCSKLTSTYRQGQPVTVLYDPQDPQHPQVLEFAHGGVYDEARTLAFTGAFVLFLGLLMVAVTLSQPHR